MAREKRRKETELQLMGQTNLAFDSSNIENAISKDKDMKMLTKNLTETENKDNEKISREKRKKRIEDTSAER